MANKAKMMKSQPGSAAAPAADPDQQQGMPRAHRIKDTVLQAVLKQQAELQRRQQSKNVVQSKSAKQVVQPKTSKQAVQTNTDTAQQQQMETAAQEEVVSYVQQELDNDLQALAAEDSSSSSTVGVASVDSTRFLMTTSPDETGMNAHGLAFLTDKLVGVVARNN
jgi:hypothetical protein